MNDPVRSDCLITEADVVQMEGELHEDDWKQELLEFWTREPELAAIVGLRISNITAVIERAKLPKDVRRPLLTQVPLLVWPALLLMHRAHRRAWDGVLPSTETFEPGDRDQVERCGVGDGDTMGFEADNRIEGITAGLHIGFFSTEFPDLDEATLKILVQKHCGAIAQEMLEAGADAARRLFSNANK
jgi:hypothetical protein